MPVIATREKVVEAVEIARADKNGKKSEDNKYPENLVWVPYI